MSNQTEAPDRIWLEYSPEEQHIHMTDKLVWTGYLTEYVKAEAVGQATIAPVFGLYHQTTRYHYDDFGSDRYETLLAVSSDPQSLKDRWNAKQKEQCLAHGYNHESYHRQIDPPFREGDKLSYPGSTGGGCAGVDHEVFIRPIPQWDETK